MTTALSLERVSVTFATRLGDVPALRDVSFEVTPGETFVLVGESGSGKSVLAHALSGLLPANATVDGVVTVGGHNVYEHTEAERNTVRADHLALIPQGATTALNPVRRLDDQLTAAARYRRLPRAEAAAKFADRLADLGLSWDTIRHLYPHQLSGGMQQRVVTVLATIGDPDLVIADEPTNGLDADLVDATATLLRTHVARGATLLVITHDLRLAQQLGGRTGVLYGASLVELGATDQVLTRPAHPYTRGLVGALPEHGGTPIPGLPVSLNALPDGCSFAPRCSLATDECRQGPPPPRAVAHGTAWCCHVDHEHAVAS